MEVYLSIGRSSICACHEHLQTEKGMNLILDQYMYTFKSTFVSLLNKSIQKQGHRKILMYGQAVLLRHQGTKKVSHWILIYIHTWLAVLSFYSCFVVCLPPRPMTSSHITLDSVKSQVCTRTYILSTRGVCRCTLDYKCPLCIRNGG